MPTEKVEVFNSTSKRLAGSHRHLNVGSCNAAIYNMI